MSDQNKIARTIYVQSRTALCMTIGVACSIPLATLPAQAHRDAPRLEARKNRINRQLDRLMQARRDNAELQRHNRLSGSGGSGSLGSGGNSERKRDLRINSINPPAGANFNLHSGRELFSAGNLGIFTNLTIDVGGNQKVVSLDTKLTAAEVVAAQQVLNGQEQTIKIGKNGAATGGTFSLDNYMLGALDKSVGGSISSLTVARNVQVIDNTTDWSLSGTLRNRGTILAAADLSGLTNTIAADQIINSKTGTIGSYSGSDLYAADVALNAASRLTNNGRISSAGNLTINAAGVYNVNDGNSRASINAGQNVNLNTQNLVNSGLIAASAGNVNISSATALDVINTGSTTGGTLQATNGDINFSVNGTVINLTGGNLLSQQVNFNAGHDGLIEASVGEITGKVNASGCVVHLAANTGNLRIGDIEAFGDPIFTNAGNITIDGGFAPTNGAPLTIIAGGNVVSGPANNGLDTSSIGSDGGDITVIAGAAFKVDASGNFVVSKKSPTGGVIDFTGGNGGGAPLQSINTQSATGNGGDVQLIAFGGAGVDSGKILIPSITVSLNGNTKGDFTAVAGAASGDAIVSSAGLFVNKATFASATASAKGGLVFDGITGAQISGVLAFKSTNAGNITFDAGNQVTADGDITINTGGDLILNDAVTTTGGNMTIAANNLNINTTGFLGTDPSSITQVVNANITNETNIGGSTFVGVMNLNTGSLNIAAGGAMNDAFENIGTKGEIVLVGRLGRQQDTTEENAAPSTLNVSSSAFLIHNGGAVSGNGTVVSGSFTNSAGGSGIGSIAYTIGGKKGGTFVNDGTIDGLHVSVNASTILNGAGAVLQATLQTLLTDVPTLTLNTSLLDNQGHIEATGRTKLSSGTLTINSLGDLKITGVDGGLVTAFSGTVNLNAGGLITVGGNDGVTDSNPFSALTTGMGNFNVKAGGSFVSTMPGVIVSANGSGENGNISIEARSISYNGMGTAPVFSLQANGAGPALSIGQKPITVILADKKTGITVGSNPGDISIDVNGFDPSSLVALSTPNSMNINMAGLNHGGTGLNLTGTGNLLITGNIVGGDDVTLTTGGKSEFQIGNAIGSGITGIVAGQGVSAIKNLTINSPGPVVINSGFQLASDEEVNLNAPGLLVHNGADIVDLDLPGPAEALALTLTTGTGGKTFYHNFNPNGQISAPVLTINSTSTVSLRSTNDKNAETVISVGTNPNSAGGLAGGGTININAGALSFPSAGITFNAASPDAGSPNGGEVNINLTTTKIVMIGLGNNRIRANVAASPGFDSEAGYGSFSMTSFGRIQATNVYNGGVGPMSIDFGLPAIGFGGSLELVSKGTTVQISGVSGIGLNSLKLSGHSMFPMLLNKATVNGIQDIDATFVGETFSFTNRGQLLTNGIDLTGNEYNFTSGTVVDLKGNAQLVANAGGPPGQNAGGVINISGATVRVHNQTGLALTALGGTDTGAIVNIKTTAPGGNLEIAAPGTGGAISIDVGTTQNNVGAAVGIDTGGSLKVDGSGLDFGASTNMDASLSLKTSQPVVVKPGKNGKPGKVVVLKNGNSLVLNNADVITGLEFGSVELSSTSNTPFLLSNAKPNNGNGLSGAGVLTAGAITINSFNSLGLGSIAASGYAMVTNDLTLETGSISFAPNQVISVVADGTVGTGGNTGVGGTITINSNALSFNSGGGVILSAQGNGANPASTGGTISINNRDTKTLILGAAGLTFDVSDTGVLPNQKAGTVSVSQTSGELLVDGNAFIFGAGDGGNLLLEAGSMLFGNVASLNASSLDNVVLKTNGNGRRKAGPFRLGGAILNGFADANPTLSAVAVTIQSSGADAGIDTTSGTVQASTLTLNTNGNINIASGGTLSVVPNTVTGNGGSIFITAAGFTQSGGSAGFTLDASGSTGAGGLVRVDVTGSAALTIGNGGLNIDISNGNGAPGGFVNVSSNGNIVLDMNAIDVGTNFGGAGPNLAFNANGVLAVNNMASIADIGIGGGEYATATIGGTPGAGFLSTIFVNNPSLPGGVVAIQYTEQVGDTQDSIAQAFVDLINANPELQGLGVTAFSDGPVITLRSAGTNTSYTASNDPDPDSLLTTTIDTFSTGVTLNSRSSQSFVLGGAAAGTNGIQDNNLNLNIGAITIGNSGSITTATIAGTGKLGSTETLTVIDSSLPGGMVSLSYTFVEGDTTIAVAAALATAVNNSTDLQHIGVRATTSGSVITLSSGSVGTTYSNTSKIKLETLANGGNIENGNLASLTGAATAVASLKASGNIGKSSNRILLNSGVDSIVINAGGNANIFNDGGAQNLTMNTGGFAGARFVSGDILNVNGTAGSFAFSYDNGNALNSNSVTLTNIATTGGALLVSSNARDLIVDGSLTTINGNIELENLNQGAPTIQILDDAIIYASGDVTQINQGNVYISIGSVPATFAPGVAPGGVTIDETQGGQVTFGSPPNPAGTITADPSATLQALGRDLAFNGSATNIIVGQNVVITADPPPYMPAPLGARASLPASLAASSLHGSAELTPHPAGAGVPPASRLLPTPITTLPAIDASVINTITLNNAHEVSNINLASLNTGLLPESSGLVPAPPPLNYTAGNGTVRSSDSVPNHTLTVSTPLAGRVSNVVHRCLENGPLLLIPQQDEVIATPYGSIAVAAKSLVLIISSETGLAVYNLHDTRRNAVTLTRNAHSVSVPPGTHALLVGSGVDSFEHANPAQFVRYRQLTSKPIDSSTKLFRAEFDVISMLNGLPAFKDLLTSKDQETRKTMLNVLKTTAILMQLSQNGDSFKHFAAPEITASNNPQPSFRD